MEMCSQRKIIEDRIVNQEGNSFQDFCNRLFFTLYPDDFSPVRPGGRSGDVKNDGYCPKERIFLGAHATRGESISKTKLKIKGDLEGCIAKHPDIKTWIYLTNDVLIGEVHQFVDELRINNPKVDVQIWDHLKIANVICDQAQKSINYIIDLDLSTGSEGIKEVLDLLKNTKAEGGKEIATSTNQNQIKDLKTITPLPAESPKKEKSTDYKKLMALYSGEGTPEKITEVKKIIYSSDDPEAILQAHLMLASWYEYSPNTIEDQNTLLEIGAAMAGDQKAPDAQAILLGTKGMNVSTQFTLLDLEGWGLVETNNRTGLLVITKEEQANLIQKLNTLDTQFKEIFKSAINKALESQNYLVISRVFCMVGSAAGGRAQHFLTLKVTDRAEIEKKVCKGAFMYAKGILIKAQDQSELALLLHNFANALRGFGEADEALELVDKSMEIAKKYKIPDFMVKAELLKDRILHPLPIPKF